MKYSKKAFTLVELIIVISILSILSTLGFISYSWYTLQARDTQRQTDLWILNNSIKLLSLRNFNISVLVNTGSIDRTWNGEFYVWGENISGASDYKAWEINFDYLTDISSPLFDPKTRKSYILWAYNTKYELAATLEGTKMSYIISSYKKRTSSWTQASLTGTIDAVNNSIELLNKEESVKFQIWDKIWVGWTTEKKIVDIIWEKIYLDNVTDISIIDTISLYKDDTFLIGSIGQGTKDSEDCTDEKNIKENICPIKEDTPFFVPYNF